MLVATYLGVSVVAYTDYPRVDYDPPLTDVEHRGLAVWREHNCQSCHQIYGFGGFLGPDLTNRITAATLDSEVSWILRDGSKAMPGFRLSPEDSTAVIAFLRMVSSTGRSQPQPLQGQQVVAPSEHLDWLARAWTDETGRDLGEPANRGAELWQRSRCGTCHLPFLRGRNLAPDISAAALDVTPEGLQSTLGQGQRRMPAFPLGAADAEDLSEFLLWLSKHRRELVDLNGDLTNVPEFSWRAVPWFEYE